MMRFTVVALPVLCMILFLSAVVRELDIAQQHADSYENQCDYVSSRGIMRSCDTYPVNPTSSTLYVNLRFNGSIIYVQGSAVRFFYYFVLPTMRSRFVLVTGDCDESVPTNVLSSGEFESFIVDERLIHWFSQNLVLRHPKMTIIPIGLDYHSMTHGAVTRWGAPIDPLSQELVLKTIARAAPPLHERLVRCYASFHFNTRFARNKAIADLDRSIVYYEPLLVERADTWRAQSTMAFVISPWGNGYDCHRTWEALVLGCIPVVLSSPIDDVFAELPVLIVEDWRDLNASVLHATLDAFSRKAFNLERLKLSYWSNLIRETGSRTT